MLAAHWSARSGLVLMSLAFAGVVWLTFSVVVGETPAHLAGGLMVVFLSGLWFLLPRAAQLRSD